MSDLVRQFQKGFNDETSASKGEPEGSVTTVYLMENYRTTTNNVNAAQKVIQNPRSITAADRDAILKNVTPMRRKGVSPHVITCEHGKAESNFVVKEIHKLQRNGLLTTDYTVAIIYPTNAQSRALEEACVANNLKYPEDARTCACNADSGKKENERK
mmetsp:Transcript_51359/g.61854  ORF Transcript_51359/g.61854 Transcript_51359/m.61854 type:complete len:158 (-) Transcript_51359:112-585(-)|eukprot:CAMPEP_0194372186 /NCGR_PEP_ID=MMETSP0174-20130528/20500_1 /TAXON_ID=216777 /ORGANISM="Proboscia alata, Strain PI-D3" /LENGTH=157 /DNA_ID=CAMNT_0039150551 /DNA_START=492 /DNA_END=965 /DNA_ORIENTATION=-